MQLISNIHKVFLLHNGKKVSLNCKNLVVDVDRGLNCEGKKICLRGFGEDSAWDIFFLGLETEDATFEITEGFPYCHLNLADGTVIEFTRSNSNLPVDVTTHKDYDSLWATLLSNSMKYSLSPAILVAVPRVI